MGRTSRVRVNSSDRFCPVEVLGENDIPGQTSPLQQPNEGEAPIGLTCMDADLRRAGISVVVVMPCLAHGWDSGPRHVVRLNSRINYGPILRAARMGKVADKPVAGNRCRHPDTDSPGDPPPSPTVEKQGRDWQLL